MKPTINSFAIDYIALNNPIKEKASLHQTFVSAKRQEIEMSPKMVGLIKPSSRAKQMGASKEKSGSSYQQERERKGNYNCITKNG